MTRQQAPSPDYSISEEPVPTMVVNREDWPAYDAGKRAAARANIDRLLDMAIMRDHGTREVLCDHCGDVAATYDRGMLAEELDGKATICETCGALGKLVLRDDDDMGHAWLAFRRYTRKEMGL